MKSRGLAVSSFDSDSPSVDGAVDVQVDDGSDGPPSPRQSRGQSERRRTRAYDPANDYKPPPKKRRPVGFTKDGRLRVASYETPGKWYELRVSDRGQLMCGGDPEVDDEREACLSWQNRGRCGHVEAGAEFLETHSCFSEEQKRFWEASYTDRYRRALRSMGLSRGPILYMLK